MAKMNTQNDSEVTIIDTYNTIRVYHLDRASMRRLGQPVTCSADGSTAPNSECC